MRFHIAAFAALFPSCLAIYSDEAFKVDTQLALLGLPQHENTFFAQPYVGSKASLLYTLSDKCVLGAINPKDGSIVWRQQLKTNGPCVDGAILRAGDNQDTLVQALDGKLQAWSAADGRLAWQRTFGRSNLIYDVQIPETGVESKEKEIIVVLVGERGEVQKLDGKNGATKWSYVDEEDEPYMVSPSGNIIYYIALHPAGIQGHTVRVTSLDSATGQKLGQVTIGSGSEFDLENDIILVGANSAAPAIVWTDSANPHTLKVNVLGTEYIESFNIKQGNGQLDAIDIHAPQQLHANSHFLVHFQTVEGHWAEIYHIDVATSRITKSHDLQFIAGQGTFSISAVDSEVYFTRFTEEDVILVSSTSQGALQKWSLNISGLNIRGKSYPVHASTEVAAKGGSSYAVRSAVLFSSGDWVMIKNGDMSWSRPESLAGIVTAQWATARVPDSLVEELKVEVRSNPVSAYIHRLRRHLVGLAGLPSFGQMILKKVATFGGESELSESFGFKKLFLAATDNGRVVALEVGGDMQTVWNVEAKRKPSGGSWDSPSLGTVKDRLPDNIASTLEFATSVDNDHTKTAYEIRDGSLQGTRGSALIWQFSPRAGQRFIDITSSYPNEPIASIGKALGDRRVLYKYLNANAIIVTAVDDHNTATIYLLDSSSGNILHAAEHSSVDTTRPIAAAISENWFAYSLSTFASDEEASTGHILVMNELYESPLANDRGPLGSTSNYSSLSITSTPHVISATFHVPDEISLLAVTQTAQGITSRQLLAYLASSGAIVGIPRQAVDPRRVVNADPTAMQMQEEGLTRYAALLDFDPKWCLTHKRDVLGVRHVSAAPAALESTSLVVAWGLDVFATRVAPSFAFDVLGGEFNKVTMSATVVVLAAAAFAVAPVIQRKMTNAMWQSV